MLGKRLIDMEFTWIPDHILPACSKRKREQSSVSAGRQGTPDYDRKNVRGRLLTAMTGVVLLVLLAVIGVTIVQIGQLIAIGFAASASAKSTATSR